MHKNCLCGIHSVQALLDWQWISGDASGDDTCGLLEEVRHHLHTKIHPSALACTASQPAHLCILFKCSMHTLH